MARRRERGAYANAYVLDDDEIGERMVRQPGLPGRLRQHRSGPGGLPQLAEIIGDTPSLPCRASVR